MEIGQAERPGKDTESTADQTGSMALGAESKADHAGEGDWTGT